MEAIQERNKRIDKLVARLGMFSFEANGARKASGGHWRESDFMPKPPMSEEAQAMLIEIQAMKLTAAQRRKEEAQQKQLEAAKPKPKAKAKPKAKHGK